MLFVMQDGGNVGIDHLPMETIIYLIRAGAEIEDSEDLLTGQNVEAGPCLSQDPCQGHEGVASF
jgi:hypothetical protein